VSQRRAARAARFHPSSLRYQSQRDPLTALRQRLRELAQTRVRFGYRRLLVMLRREGWDVGRQRLYRGQRGGAGPAPQTSLAACHGRASGAASAIDGSQPHLEHGFRGGRIGRRPPIPGADGDRSVHTRMPGDRRGPRLVCISLRQRHQFVSAAMDLWAYTRSLTHHDRFYPNGNLDRARIAWAVRAFR
jgi:hypothetical protein